MSDNHTQGNLLELPICKKSIAIFPMVIGVIGWCGWDVFDSEYFKQDDTIFEICSLILCQNTDACTFLWIPFL